MLLHAIVDALLGAIKAGDIGRRYPDTDMRYAGVSSRVFLKGCAELLRQRGWEVINLDATVLLQAPKIAPQTAAMEDAIALICRNLAVTKIVAVTISGYAARMISARRPSQPILAVSNDAMAARSFNLFAGVEGVHIDIPFPRDSTDHVVRCLKELWHRGLVVGDDLVLLSLVGYPRSGNRMNVIQTHHISDLADTLGWDTPRAAHRQDLSLVDNSQGR